METMLLYILYPLGIPFVSGVHNRSHNNIDAPPYSGQQNFHSLCLFSMPPKDKNMVQSFAMVVLFFC